MRTIKRTTLFLVGCMLLLMASATAAVAESYPAPQAKDYVKAVAEARQAAGKGDPHACFLLGTLYQAGLGVEASPQEAAAWFEKAAEKGVAPAYSRLALLHSRGKGVPKDEEKALAYARKAADLGDPEGMVFVYVSLKTSALGYLDDDRKVDHARYTQLAGRPLSERSLDEEAQDALYRASGKGYPFGMYLLAMSYGETLGEGNRERLLELVGKLPKPDTASLQSMEKMVRNSEKIARYINGLGPSLATPKAFMDAQLGQMVAATARTCGLKKRERSRVSLPVLTSISISKPLTGAVYLPSSVPGFEHAYLVAGEWEEGWTYKGCDKTETLRVRFVADGFGGARFSSTVDVLGKEKP